jgi:hypothetical protein
MGFTTHNFYEPLTNDSPRLTSSPPIPSSSVAHACGCGVSPTSVHGRMGAVLDSHHGSNSIFDPSDWSTVTRQKNKNSSSKNKLQGSCTKSTTTACSVTTAKVDHHPYHQDKSFVPHGQEHHIAFPTLALPETHAPRPVLKPHLFGKPPRNAWNVPQDSQDLCTNDANFPKHPSIPSIERPNIPEHVLGLNPNRRLELDTHAIPRNGKAYGIVPRMDPCEYQVYEAMIEFMTIFHKLPLALQESIFKEFNRSPHLSTLSQRTFYHVLNHNVWHLKSTEQWCGDLDYDCPYWNVADRITGICLPMAMINKSSLHLENFRFPGKKSGSRFLEPKKQPPTCRFCSICGKPEEAFVANVVYDLDDPSSLFPPDPIFDHVVYMATTEDEPPPSANVPHTPLFQGIITWSCAGFQTILNVLSPPTIETKLPSVEEVVEEGNLDNVSIPPVDPLLPDTNAPAPPLDTSAPFNILETASVAHDGDSDAESVQYTIVSSAPSAQPSPLQNNPINVAIPSFSVPPLVVPHNTTLPVIDLTNLASPPKVSIPTTPGSPDSLLPDHSSDFQKTIPFRYFSPAWYKARCIYVKSLIPTDVSATIQHQQISSQLLVSFNKQAHYLSLKKLEWSADPYTLATVACSFPDQYFHPVDC